MFEGSRAFDLAWGATTGTLCLAVAVVVLWRLLKPGVSPFGERIDPKRHLQLAYGLVTMGMAFTNYGCRFIPHDYLIGVHEGFAAITFVLLTVLGTALAARPAPLVAPIRRPQT